MNRSIDKNYIYIGLTVLLIFLISSNIAWLNPYPGKGLEIKMPEKIPFMWQYNRDAGLEIKSSAFFPEYYREDPTRVNRPIYAFLTHTLGFFVTWWIPFVININPNLLAFISAAGGFVVLKLSIYLIGGILLYRLLNNFFDSKISIFAVILLFLNKYSIEGIALYPTTARQYRTPIFAVYLFYDLTKDYSHRKNMIYSFIIGILMLAKENYAPYVAIILFALCNRRFKETGISIITHFMPLAIWLVILNILGIPYYNHEFADGGQQVVWIFNDFIFSSPILMVKTILVGMHDFFVNLALNYSFWLLVPVASIIYAYKDKIINRQHILFISLLFVSTFAQMFASKRYLGYMTMDIAFIVFALSAYFVVKMIRLNSLQKHENKILIAIAILWLLMSLAPLVNLPWVHPFDQPIEPLLNKSYLANLGIDYPA